MSNRQLIQPQVGTRDGIGWCLRHSRSVFGVPARTGFPHAWSAWEKAQHKHADRNIPTDVAVVLYFSYFDKGINKGHTVVSVPGVGLLSSIYSGQPGRQYQHDLATVNGIVVGRAILPSIEEVERLYHCKFVGWAEDVNGTRVAECLPNPVPAPPGNGHPLEQYVGKTVHLSAAAGTWRVYPVGSVAPRTAVATLKVAKFGGLDYRIEATDRSLNSVVISTRDFGKVSLPTAQDNRGTLYPTATIS